MRLTPEEQLDSQRLLDRLWYESGYEDMGIGFAHGQPPVSKTHPSTCTCPACYEHDMPDGSWWGGDPQGADALTPHEPTDPDQYEGDPLNTARGCLIGCIMGLIIWALIIWGAYEWLKP